MSKFISILLIICSILFLNSNIQAKVDKFELEGVIKFYWLHLNNGFDKTTTRVLSTGPKLYDDLDEHAFSFFALNFKMYTMENVHFGIRISKKDVLWASHNNYFNSEHTQSLNDFFGETSEVLKKPNHYGLKVDRLYVEARELMDGYLNFIGGRQLYSGTSFKEDISFKNMTSDLFVYLASDGIFLQLDSWNFLFFQPEMQTDFFMFKINEMSAEMYASSGGYIWERQYGDGDINLYGLINKLDYKKHLLKNYFALYHKGGRLLLSGDENEDGYDNRYLIGLSYSKKEFFLKHVTFVLEGGYMLGNKAVGTYYDLDNTLDWVEKEYYGEAKYQSYIYRIGIELKKTRFTGSIFNTAGSSDDPATPGTIEGFYGFNEAFHSRTYGMEGDYSGYGEIFKANPYQHNFSYGDPLVESDERFVNPALCKYPAGTVGLFLSYQLLSTSDEENKLIPSVEYFYYYPLPGYPVIAVRKDGTKYKASSFGMETDFSLKYIYKYNFILRAVYGLYLPGNAFAGGYNQIIQEEIGKDPVELVKFEMNLYF